MAPTQAANLCSVMFVPITHNLVCDLALAPVPVVVVQGAVNKPRNKNKGTDEIDDFHESVLEVQIERETYKRVKRSFGEGASHAETRYRS